MVCPTFPSNTGASLALFWVVSLCKFKCVSFVCKLKCVSFVYKKNIRKRSNPILVQLIFLIIIITECILKERQTPIFHFEKHSCMSSTQLHPHLVLSMAMVIWRANFYLVSFVKLFYSGSQAAVSLVFFFPFLGLQNHGFLYPNHAAD